jgi:hypothetical protein
MMRYALEGESYRESTSAISVEPSIFYPVDFRAAKGLRRSLPNERALMERDHLTRQHLCDQAWRC